MVSRSLGLSTFVLASPFSDADVRRFGEVRAWGYDVVEVCVEDPALLTGSAVAAAAADAGLQVLVCGAFGPTRDVSSEDPQVRRRALEYLDRCSDLAAAVGSPLVSGPMYATTGVARLLPPEARAAQWSRAVDGLREAARRAAERGVSLAVEPLNRFETDLVNTVAQGVQLCEDVGESNLGLMLDTFHMNLEEKSLPAAVRTAGQHLFHVQFSENDRGAPGSGHIDFPGVVDALDRVEYAGAVVVESFLPTVAEIARAVSLWRPVAESMEALAAGSAAYLRPLLRPGGGRPV